MNKDKPMSDWVKKFDKTFDLADIWSPKEMKSFIQTLLKEQEEEFKWRQQNLTIERQIWCEKDIEESHKELKEKIEGMKVHEEDNDYLDTWHHKERVGYNKALQDIIDILK